MKHDKLTVRLAAVAKMFDVSTSTVRRWMRADPDFPAPFRMTPNGDLLWSFDSLQECVARKTGKARAA